MQLQVAQQGLNDWGEELGSENMGLWSAPQHLPQFLTLLRHVQSLHCWLHWEYPLVAWAPGCLLMAGLLR